MRSKKLALALAVSVSLSAIASHAEDNLTDAIKNGEVHLDFRLRYENVDQSKPADLDGDALTLRSRLNYKTAGFHGFTAFLEMDDVSAVDNSSYNSTTNGETDKAVIADPKGTEVNQAWLQYVNWDTHAIFGRQRINLDNQRFIGGVGFRQNEQTFNAFSISNQSLPDTTLFYARVDKVKRIFGEDSDNGSQDNSTDLFNAKYNGLSLGAITAYAYLIDNEDAARFSTDTYGIRFVGKTGDDLKFNYALEYAHQEDSNNNTLNYEADYILAELGIGFSASTIKLGYEVLGSDDGEASFITPLATLHKFQGWTDQFLTTPDEGIQDLYVSAGTTLVGIKLLAVYHQFTADEKNTFGDDDLGSEFGVKVAKNFDGYGLSLIYATYDAGDNSFGKSDTDKLWITATAKF